MRKYEITQFELAEFDIMEFVQWLYDNQYENFEYTLKLQGFVELVEEYMEQKEKEMQAERLTRKVICEKCGHDKFQEAGGGMGTYGHEGGSFTDYECVKCKHPYTLRTSKRYNNIWVTSTTPYEGKHLYKLKGDE